MKNTLHWWIWVQVAVNGKAAKRAKVVLQYIFIINLISLSTLLSGWIQNARTVYGAFASQSPRRSYIRLNSGKRKQKNGLRFALNGSYGSYLYSFRCTRLSARGLFVSNYREDFNDSIFYFLVLQKLVKIEDDFWFFTENSPFVGLGISRINFSDSYICPIPYRIANDLFVPAIN